MQLISSARQNRGIIKLKFNLWFLWCFQLFWVEFGAFHSVHAAGVRESFFGFWGFANTELGWGAYESIQHNKDTSKAIETIENI